MKKLRIIYCIVLIGFILGCHNGYLALWENDDPSPVQVFPYCVESVPVQYHAALIRGIPVESYSALVELFKQYLS